MSMRPKRQILYKRTSNESSSASHIDTIIESRSDYFLQLTTVWEIIFPKKPISNDSSESSRIWSIPCILKECWIICYDKTWVEFWSKCSEFFNDIFCLFVTTPNEEWTVPQFLCTAVELQWKARPANIHPSFRLGYWGSSLRTFQQPGGWS